MSEETVITPPTSPPPQLDSILITHDENFLHQQKITSFRWFACNGAAKLEGLKLSDESYLNNNEELILEPKRCLLQCPGSKECVLFNRSFDFGSVFLYDSKLLFRLARSEIFPLESAASANQISLHTFSQMKKNQDHLNSRRMCVEFFLHLREYLFWCSHPKFTWILPSLLPAIEEQLSGFSLFLRKITDLPDFLVLHPYSQQGNKCLEASHQLFHCHLDLRWLMITSLHQLAFCRQSMPDSSSQASDSSVATELTLDHAFASLITDLVKLALMQYEKVDKPRGLLIKSPFSCSCVTELWILLQVFTNTLHAKGTSEGFWSLLQKVLIGSRDTLGSVSNHFAFSLWLVKHLAMLSTHKKEAIVSSYPLLEKILKGLLASDEPEASMRVYLMHVEKILIKYWEPKSEIIILLWEYFQKRLNSTFYVPGSSIDSVAIVSESVIGLVKQVKSRLTNRSVSDNSFHIFLRTLGVHLQRVSGHSGPHWNQIRGRIFSKLSPTKVQALTENGLYNLSSLFLTLATTADLLDVSTKLQALLGSLKEEELEGSTRRLVWRSRLALCLLLAERGQDLTAALSPLTAALDTPHHDLPLCRTFLDGLRDILDVGTGLKIDHNLLLGNWMTKYMAECLPNDATRLLEFLAKLIERVRKQRLDNSNFQSSVWQRISTQCHLWAKEGSFPQLADVCLSLCQLTSPPFPSPLNNATLRQILILIVFNNTTDIMLVRRFLWLLVQQMDVLAMLKDFPPTSSENHEVLLMRGWIKCSLLSLDGTDGEMSRITSHVAYLPFISEISMDLTSAKDPLTHFIVAVSNKFKNSVTLEEKASLRARMTCYLTGLDGCIERYIKHSTSPELLKRIYHIIGLMVSLMPSFIYTKSKSDTVLKGLLDVMFLPNERYKPNFKLDPDLRAAISGNIHLFFRGLGDLVEKMQDACIDRWINDLIKIYLPWLVKSDRECYFLEEVVARNDSTSRKVLNTVCSVFIKRKAAVPDVHCAHALDFLSSVASTYSRDLQVIHTLVDCCFEHACDVFMFCDGSHVAKPKAITFLGEIFRCSCYGDSLSELIMTKCSRLTTAYLSFSPGKLFPLFHELLRHRPELVVRSLPLLCDQVKVAEARRGVLHDASLRQYIKELETAVSCLRNR